MKREYVLITCSYMRRTLQKHLYHVYTRVTDWLYEYIPGVKQVHRTAQKYLQPVHASWFFTIIMPAYISIQALFRHVFISGSSGSGKTVVIRTCLLQNLRITRHFREFTIFLMEPHGDLCGEALRFCLNKVRSGKTWWMKTLEAFTGRKVRLNRLVYIDPDVRGTINVELGKDLLTENVRCVLPIFEVKDRSDENELSLVTQELVEALYEIFGVDEEWGQRQLTFSATINTLLRTGGMSLNDLKDFMDDNKNLELIKLWWQNPVPEYRDFFKGSFITGENNIKGTKTSLLMKLSLLLAQKEFKEMFCGTGTIDFEKIVNGGYFIVVKLAKWVIGTWQAQVAWRLIFAKIKSICLRRAAVEKKKRKHLLAYMDEFQNFVTASFPTTLEEMRKYHFHLVVATQFVGQNMPTEYVRSLLGNTKLLIGAESDPASNQVLGEIMGMDKPKGDYVKLPKHHLWVFDKTRERKKKYDYKLRPKKFKVPKVIANMQSNLYLTNAELEELFMWLINESWFYTTEMFVETVRDRQSSHHLKDLMKEQHSTNGLGRLSYSEQMADRIDNPRDDTVVPNPRKK